MKSSACTTVCFHSRAPFWRVNPNWSGFWSHSLRCCLLVFDFADFMVFFPKSWGFCEWFLFQTAEKITSVWLRPSTCGTSPHLLEAHDQWLGAKQGTFSVNCQETEIRISWACHSCHNLVVISISLSLSLMFYVCVFLMYYLVVLISSSLIVTECFVKDGGYFFVLWSG